MPAKTSHRRQVVTGSALTYNLQESFQGRGTLEVWSEDRFALWKFIAVRDGFERVHYTHTGPASRALHYTDAGIQAIARDYESVFSNGFMPAATVLPDGRPLVTWQEVATVTTQTAVSGPVSTYNWRWWPETRPEEILAGDGVELNGHGDPGPGRGPYTFEGGFQSFPRIGAGSAEIGLCFAAGHCRWVRVTSSAAATWRIREPKTGEILSQSSSGTAFEGFLGAWGVLTVSSPAAALNFRIAQFVHAPGSSAGVL